MADPNVNDSLGKTKNVNDRLKFLEVDGSGGGGGGTTAPEPAIPLYDAGTVYNATQIVLYQDLYYERTLVNPGTSGSDPVAGGTSLWKPVHPAAVKYALVESTSSSYNSILFDGSVDFFTGDTKDIAARSVFDGSSGWVPFSELTARLDDGSNSSPTQQYTVRYDARGTILLPVSLQPGSWIVETGYLTYDISTFSPPFAITPLHRVDIVDAGLSSTQLVDLRWSMILDDYIDERRIVPVFRLGHASADPNVIYGAGNPLTLAKYSDSSAAGGGHYATLERVK